MRLVIKLVLASLVTMVTVLAIYAYLSIVRHRESLVEDMQRDHRTMAGVLVEAIDAVAEQYGEEEARSLVEEVNRRRENVHLEWRPVEPEGDEPAEVTQATFAEDEDGGAPRLETRATVTIRGRPVGTLLLVESFAEGEQVLQTRMLRIGVTALLMLAVGTVVGGSLGALLVGRRVAAMVDQARRVASGDLDRRIERLGTADELGQLGRELNDMTERLAEARARLRDETAARLRTLEQLRHGERLMTVGKLAAGLAHELGTPLNVVTESAKMIARGETSGPETVEYAGIIAEQGERMTRILRQLMDFARRRAPKREEASFRALSESTIALLMPLADRRSVSLRVEGDDPPPVRVDVGQMQQVLTNLVVNAIQASPESGEVVVDLRACDAVNPSTPDAKPSSHVRITVTDTGPGIAEEDLPRVFEPFFTTKDVGEGTGLGLSVAYGIVVDHGGWIDVEPRRAEGASGRVWGPCASAGGARATDGASLPS